MTSSGRGALELPQARPLERRRLQCYLALMIGDCTMLFAGYLAIGYVYLGVDGAGQASVLAQLVLPLFLTIALYNGAYSMDALIQPRIGTVRALAALTISVALVVFIAYYTKSSAEFSRILFTAGFGISGAAMIWMRAQMRWFVRWRCGGRVLNEMVIVDGGPAIDLPGAVHIAASRYGIVPALDDPAALNRIGMLLHAVDRVVISCPPKRRVAWSIILKSANVDGELIDDSVAELGAQGARISGEHGFLRVSLGPLGLRARATKRIFDVTVAGGALILLSPLLVLVTLAILVEDGAPVLFTQRRVGRSNRFFDVYKFRSMRTAASDQEGNQSTQRDDDRVTLVGRFIRRTSIDELPQLINVLIGEMSSVVRKLAQRPYHRVAGAQLCRIARRQPHRRVASRNVGDQRQRQHGGSACRAEGNAPAADLTGEFDTAEIVNDIAGEAQRCLRASGHAGFSRGHRFHAVPHLAKADALGADCRRIGDRGPDRRSIIGHPVALGARKINLHAPVFRQGTEVAAVA